MTKQFFGCAVLMMLMVGWLPAEGMAEVGADLVDVFSRAAQGRPLRYVVIGGSITQASESVDGWIGAWLRQKFPKSQVTVVNSGMSATGSELGVFRIERDIIAHDPDLVGIEYCVNDSGLTDEKAVRYMESIVVRLKRLPHPPAIFFIEAAMEKGVNLQRHRRVARHYGIFEVDLQAAVDQYLHETIQPWSALFSDAVHANDAGHAFYAKIISERLEALAALAKENAGPPTPKTLPAPLSDKPLLLDGRMVRLSSLVAPGWKTNNSTDKWYGRFFSGVLIAEEPATVLQLPVRGSFIGLLYLLDPTYGSFYASVDGAQPKSVYTNLRGGYEWSVLGADLAPREHLLTLVLPPKQAVSLPLHSNGPINLGYALVAGAEGSTGEAGVPGEWSADRLRGLGFLPVPVEQFSWADPQHENPPREAHDGLDFLKIVYGPEDHGSELTWHAMPLGKSPWIDLSKIQEAAHPVGLYLRTKITSPTDRSALLGLAVDYFAKLWLNGELVMNLNGTHGSPRLPQFIPVKLKTGENDVLLKIGTGSAGFGCCLMYEAPH